jgi:hypothetical protein
MRCQRVTRRFGERGGGEVFARSFVQRITAGDSPKFSAVEPPPSPSRWDVVRKQAECEVGKRSKKQENERIKCKLLN